jgi:hypothetical protein
MEQSMPNLWSHTYTKDQLMAFTSTMTSLAGLRPFVFEQGRTRGMRGIEGWTGSGLRFTLLPDRALDIGPVWFKDKPISWDHPALASPVYYEPTGAGWLRTFGGGLLTTCGLTHFGAPDTFKGQDFGLHGRIANIPADNLRIWQEWREENFWLIIEGEMRQTVLFGENLTLQRRIETQLGSNSLAIKDRVINNGSQPVPHALLYHCNIGFPLVSPESRLIVEDIDLKPRDSEAAPGLANYDRFEPPTVGYKEKVFFHTPKVDSAGYATASLVNPELNLGIQLRLQAKHMPILTQWKMMGKGEYVCGLEPATHAMAPRDELSKKGLPAPLIPGEEVGYELQLSVMDNI